MLAQDSSRDLCSFRQSRLLSPAHCGLYLHVRTLWGLAAFFPPPQEGVNSRGLFQAPCGIFLTRLIMFLGQHPPGFEDSGGSLASP